MAPPPSTPSTLQDRLLKLAQTLQFAWFVGHVSMLLFTLRYFLFYISMRTASSWARFSYRTAFVSALVTYGIVVYKSYRARVRQGKPTGVLALAQDENVQYLAVALTWLLSYQVPLALLPFVVYSVFHVATYIRSNILPTITPPTPSPVPVSSPKPTPAKPSGPLADAIGRFIKEYYDASMSLVALLEIALLFRIAFSALIFTKGSWILLALYGAFFRARYAQSSFVQGAVANLGARGDAVLGNQAGNPQVRQAWETVKGLLKQVEQATDLGRFVQKQPVAGQKKAQ